MIFVWERYSNGVLGTENETPEELNVAELAAEEQEIHFLLQEDDEGVESERREAVWFCRATLSKASQILKVSKYRKCLFFLLNGSLEKQGFLSRLMSSEAALHEERIIKFLAGEQGKPRIPTNGGRGGFQPLKASKW